jgi:hypothetical protein
MHRLLVLLACTVVAVGCATGKPKTVLIAGVTTPEASAILHPTVVPGGQMMIRAIDGKSTYTFSVGYLGSVYVPPGMREIEVEVSHGFAVQDAGGPAWTAPEGVACAPLAFDTASSSVLVTKGVSRPRAALDSGKTYEVRFAFDRRDPSKPVPCVLVDAMPGR